MTDEWNGVERRLSPDRRTDLTAAVLEMRALKESVIHLAAEVGQTMTKDELVTVARRIRLLLFINIVLMLVIGLDALARSL